MKTLSNVLASLMFICIIGIVFYIIGAIIVAVLSGGKKLPSMGGGVWIGLPVCYLLGGVNHPAQVFMLVILVLVGLTNLSKELSKA